LIENVERRQATETLISEKKTDYSRWSDPASLMSAWDLRTEKIAEFIGHDASVFEFGAGTGVLREALHDSCDYVKSDIVARDDETVVVDLNSDDFEPITDFDYAVFSGVLEYIHDVPKLVAYLSEYFQYVVCSYAVLESNTDSRRDHGWVNDYSMKLLIQTFKQAGFVLVDSSDWKTQKLFKFKRHTTNLNANFDFIDHTFVISLASAQDRKTHIRSEFLAMGLSNYSFFNATDYSTQEVLELCISEEVKKYPGCFRCGIENCRCPNNVLIPKQIANWLSFLKVLSVVDRGDMSLAMICEDDVKFTYYANALFGQLNLDPSLLGELRSDKPTLIRLGYPGFTPEVHKYNDTFVFTDNKHMSNSCFICNSAYAQHVLSELAEIGTISHTSDVFFHQLAIDERVAHYTVVPPPSFDLSQSKFLYSDIHPKNIDKFDRLRERGHVKKINRNIGYSDVFGGNFGDLIGPYLFKALTGIEPVSKPINDAKVRDNLVLEHYLVVGSILKHAGPKSILWGIGIMDPNDAELIKEKISPDQVFAVRGPRTKAALNEAGIKLPQDVVFGDPGLLMPLVCPSKVQAKYRFGIVPHFTEYEAVVDRYKDYPDTLVICLGNHDSVDAISGTIELITSCERILSSSLHGIVLAHAYGIASAWCHFTEITLTGQMGTNSLKFWDYLESVGLHDVQPLKCIGDHAELPGSESFTWVEPKKIAKIQFDLLNKCPFNVYGLTAGTDLQKMRVSGTKSVSRILQKYGKR
jgi:pyruvyltransferase